MITTFLVLVILFFIILWSIAWIKYYNRLDKRLGNSLWRWSFDYQVVGNRDISIIDDKNFVLLRRKRNRAITAMYFIVFFSFFILLSFVTQLLYFILT